MEKTYDWHKIALHINELPFAENNIAVIKIKGKKVCLGLFNDEVFAFNYLCPHAGKPLADGYIDAQGRVVCPLHRYKFDMRNGRNVTGEGYFLKRWPIENREDGIYLGLEPSGFFLW